MRNTLLIPALFLLTSLNGIAQGEPRFYAEVEPTEAAVGTPIRVSFILENGKGGGRFIPPDWAAAGFVVLGSSQSSSMSIMNGETKASASYNFTIAPADTGALTIPAVSIKNGDGELSTEPVVVTALPNNDGVRPALPKRSPAQPQPEPKKKIKTIRM